MLHTKLFMFVTLDVLHIVNGIFRKGVHTVNRINSGTFRI